MVGDFIYHRRRRRWPLYIYSNLCAVPALDKILP